jgi:hypothetical protein
MLVVIARTASKSSGSFVSLLGVQLLNDSTIAYDSMSLPLDHTSRLNEGSWLPFVVCNSSQSISPVGVPLFALNLPLTVSSPTIILGVHIRVKESSSIVASPRTYTWMLHIELVSSHPIIEMVVCPSNC